MTSIKGTVSGRVQGVGFRYFLMQCALKEQLAGYVRNLADGRVEFFLQGDSDSIEVVIAKARIGPDYSKVIDVTFEESRDHAIVNGFQIR